MALKKDKVIENFSQERISEENKILYDTNHRRYDLLHWYFRDHFQQRMWKNDLKFIRRKLSFEEGKRPLVLDVGAGTGNLTLKLLQLDCDVVAIDISSEMLKVLESKIEEENPKWMDRVEFIHSDFFNFIKNNQRKFDAVVECSVLHHFVKYEKYLDYLDGLLKPEAYVYIAREPLSKRELPSKNKKLASLTNAFLLWLQERLIKKYREKRGKAPDEKLATYHMHKSGIDLNMILDSTTKSEYGILNKYIFNQRFHTMISYLDNVLLKSVRIYRFNFTFFNAILKKMK